MEYNGWTNSATWNVNLWIDNEYRLYRSKRGLLALNPDPSKLTAERVKEMAIEILGGTTTPDLDSSDSGERLRWEDINWQEIADEWKEELELDS